MIVVVGGSGFIGTVLLSHLARVDGAESIKLVDKTIDIERPVCDAILADVRDIQSLRKAISKGDVIYNLAAEHRDDVNPISLYDEVNVNGAKNICQVAREQEVGTIVFTSSVAVYAASRLSRDEKAQIAPSTPYGVSKASAEQIYIEWQEESPNTRKLIIVRPTAVFGPSNRGNIYALCKQVAENKFVHIGSGENKKSLAYVDNLVSFLVYVLDSPVGISIHNYVDKPDYDMNELVAKIARYSHAEILKLRLPYMFALFASYIWVAIVRVLGRQSAITPDRIRKYSSNTVFDTNFDSVGFVPSIEMERALQQTVEYEFSDLSGG